MELSVSKVLCFKRPRARSIELGTRSSASATQEFEGDESLTNEK